MVIVCFDFKISFTYRRIKRRLATKMSTRRKRYREYYRSTDAKVPKTTAWRLKRKQKKSFDSPTAVMLKDLGKYKLSNFKCNSL